LIRTERVRRKERVVERGLSCLGRVVIGRTLIVALSVLLLFGAAASGAAAGATKLSCSTISAAFITQYLGVAVTAPSSTGWDRVR
jgi:sugar phosphate permease